LRQIVQNAGGEGSVVVARVLTEKLNIGYNAETSVYEDLVVSGVIDPAKVVRSALQNAASVAGLALTTETLITDIPEKKEAPSMGGPGGMGGMGGGMDY
jgi:chaperonin GroEL